MREIKVGDTAQRSMLVTDEQIDLFARLSGDRNPLHFDEDFARKTKFGRRVVHGGVTRKVELTSLFDLTGRSREEMVFDKEKLLSVYDQTKDAEPMKSLAVGGTL